MRTSALFSVLFLLIILSACGGDAGNDTQQKGQADQQQPQIEQQESDIPYNFRLEMETLLEHYFELKDAVTDSNIEAASTAAGEMSAFTSSVLDEVLGAENQGLWLGIARIIRTESDKLISTDSTADMRIYFEHISRTVIRVAESFDPAGGPYYLMECEEAATGDNQWLSRDEEIRNPYQTTADLNCGEVLEEL